MRCRVIDRQVPLVVALIAFATAACFHQLVMHPRDLLVGAQRNGLNDVTAYFLAARAYPADALSQFGQFPFWNPYVLSGTPFLSNPQSAVFYPPNSIFLVLDAATVISWMLVLHHFWAGVGTALLCRRYGLSMMGSVAAASIFASSPFLIAQTGEGHYNQICAVSWIPWAFLAWEWLKAGQRGGCRLCGSCHGHVLLLWSRSGALLSGIDPHVSGDSRGHPAGRGSTSETRVALSRSAVCWPGWQPWAWWLSIFFRPGITRG